MKTLRRRRKEHRTDYAKRLKLLKSDRPRITFRKTNRYIISQYITSKEAQDTVQESVSSKMLIGYGWPDNMKGSLKSVPASYLTGLLIGKAISEKKGASPVCDIGMIKKIQKNKFFAFLKGLKDAGVDVSCDEKLFPEEDRIKGKNLKTDSSKIVEEVKSKIQNG